MSTWHTVQPGECLSSIAHRYGHQHWENIYNHDENEAFRRRRPDPNVIRPGDRLFVPTPPESDEVHEIATGREHVFPATRAKTVVRVRVLDEEGRSLAGKTYELDVEGDVKRGVTDGQGIVEQSVHPAAQRASLVVWSTDDEEEGPYRRWDVRIGHLDPATTVAGIQARLNNLGFYCGAADGRLGRRTRAALKGFQRIEHLPMSGTPDEATRARLVERHGGR